MDEAKINLCQNDGKEKKKHGPNFTDTKLKPIQLKNI